MMEKAVEGFLQHLVVEKGFSQNTLEAYRNDLGQFTEFVKGRLNGASDREDAWRFVDLNLLNDYITDLRVRKGYRDTTTARKVAAIKSFFTFLAQNGDIDEPPTESLGSPRVGRALPKFLSEEEVGRLLEEAGKPGTAESQRDANILELLYATGLRVSELVSLNVQDIELSGVLHPLLGQGFQGTDRLCPRQGPERPARVPGRPADVAGGVAQGRNGPVRKPPGRAVDPPMGLEHPQELQQESRD